MKKNYLKNSWILIYMIGFFHAFTGKAQVNTYGFSASSGTYTPLVGATSSGLAATSDDNLSAALPIGFSFVYNGIPYTTFKVNSNGAMFFGTGNTGAGNNLAITTTSFRPGLAPLWDDLQCTEGITYQLNGVAPNQTLTVEWKNMEWNYQSNTPVISFQVILHETSNQIDFVYQQEATAVNSGSASIGLMGTTPTDYISLQGTGTNPTRSTTTSNNNLNTKPATGQIYTWNPPSCIAPNTLTATNITDASAELGWTQSGGVTTWEIEYGTAGFTPTGVANVAGPITNPQILGGLTQNTSYSFYVRADCGGGDFSAWSGPYTFTTGQTPASIPYTDDFSSNNWVLSNGTQTNKWFIGTAAGNPANGLYISNDNGVTNAYSTGSTSTTHAVKLFALPSGSNDFDLTFDWKSNGEAGYDYIRVWVIPASASPTPGTQITTGNITGAVQLGSNFQANSSYTSQSLIIPNSFAGTNAKIVFEWKNDFGGGSQPPGSIDNINISVITCSAPSALTATNITDASAELGWTQSGGVTTWEIEYGTAGFTPTGVANVAGPITNPQILGGLTQNTSYSFYVRADCGGGDFSTWSGPFSFTTKQTPVTLPYTDDFTSNQWALGNGSQTNKWYVGGAAGNPADGLYISNDNGVTNTYSTVSSSVVHASKLISFTAGSNPFELSFDWKNDGESGYDYLRVWIIPASASPTPGTQITTGNISGAIQLGGNLSGNTTYTTETFLIPNIYAGTNAKLVFEWRNDGSGGSQPPASIDNVSIVELACAAPTALTATSNSGTTAELSWTENGTATVWEIEYGTTGFTPTGTANATGPITNPYLLTGLTAETTYDFYVRSDCGGNFSVWSGPFTFTTSGIPDAPVIMQDPTTPTCVTGTDLDLTGSPEPNVYWFWQTSLTGTSISEPYTGPITVYYNGTYYANAYDSITGLWSSTTASFVVSNIPLATAPPAPVAAQNPSCVPLGTTLSVPAPTAGFEYYWQGTTEGGTSTSNDATNPYTATASGTYYVAAYETATSCWSNTVGVTITVDSYIPDAPTAAVTQYNICSGETTLPIEANLPVPGTETVSSGTINISIPDNNLTGINSSLIMSNIPSGATITDLSVTVNISHNWTEDIEINLTAPNGTTIDLSSNNGDDGDNYTNTVFSSNGVNPITGGTPPFTGTFAAEGNMSSLLSVPNGTWELNVIDDASIISGTLNNWSVSITYSLPTTIVEWYDAASNGNLEGIGSPFESIGTSLLPSPAATGSYEFYAETVSGGCNSTSRTLVTVSVNDVNVELTAIDASCNGAATGSFDISDTLCGVTPFLVDIDGGGFGPIPTNLIAGTYQITVQDDNGAISPIYTLVINEAGAPSDAYMENITDNGGQVSWNSNGNETEWNVEWGLPGFTPGTGTEIGSTQATDTFAIITGLDANTNYDVYVSANCGVGSTTGGWDMVNWTTDCGIYGLPFVETFEDNSDTRVCWNNEYEIDNADWTYQTGSSGGAITTAYEGSKNARFVSVTGTDSPVTKLTSPRFDFSGQDSVAVIFAYAQEAWLGDQNRTKVYTSGASASWTEIASYTTSVNSWTVDTLYVADTTVQIAFEGINNFGRANVVDYVQFMPCSLTPGTDGTTNVCRLDGTFDLNTVITKGEDFGTWSFDLNPTLLNGSIVNLSALPTGTYEFHYIVKTPCAVDTTTATLSIFPPSSAGVDGSITACRNEPIYLLSGLSGNVDLGGQWFNPQNNPTTVNVTTSNIPGSYNFDYVVSNGVCPNDTSNILVTVGTCDYLDVQELVFGDMNVYPNPTEDLVFITTGSSETFSYELLDVKGQLLSSKEAAINGTKTTEISFEKLEPGIYMIRVYNSEAEKTFRIVKQ